MKSSHPCSIDLQFPSECGRLMVANGGDGLDSKMIYVGGCIKDIKSVACVGCEKENDNDDDEEDDDDDDEDEDSGYAGLLGGDMNGGGKTLTIGQDANANYKKPPKRRKTTKNDNNNDASDNIVAGEGEWWYNGWFLAPFENDDIPTEDPNCSKYKNKISNGEVKHEIDSPDNTDTTSKDPEHCSRIKTKLDEFLRHIGPVGSYNYSLQQQKGFHNPRLVPAIAHVYDIKQYNSNYPTSIYDPDDVKEDDCYDTLRTDQKKREKEIFDEKRKRQSIEFTQQPQNILLPSPGGLKHSGSMDINSTMSARARSAAITPDAINSNLNANLAHAINIASRINTTYGAPTPSNLSAAAFNAMKMNLGAGLTAAQKNAGLAAAQSTSTSQTTTTAAATTTTTATPAALTTTTSKTTALPKSAAEKAKAAAAAVAAISSSLGKGVNGAQTYLAQQLQMQQHIQQAQSVVRTGILPGTDVIIGTAPGAMDVAKAGASGVFLPPPKKKKKKPRKLK